ncbi:dihydroorotate dehydrogenase-like protein [candidate division KSB1 bacterium]|nr:dihydroorotate dehydrogenase-like protein [candidate division KSB1 bacterium]
MDLSTKYMGLPLKNPLVPSASPLSEEIHNIKAMEDAGAAAVVLHSLFEEQIAQEEWELYYHTTQGTESFAEALTYFPETDKYVLGPEEYLEYIRKVKETVGIPVIGSLNGVTTGGWIDYARKIEEAGADALELNIYYIPTDYKRSAADVERIYLEILKSIKSIATIPIAIKLSPFFSSMPMIARKLDEIGADALVLFNRFYQPDIDLEKLEVVPNILLSTPQDMRLPLRWIAILYGHVNANLAATGGIHNAESVLKMLMVGADVTMVCSTLLKNGIARISDILKDMQCWMEEHEYTSVSQLKGSMSQKSVANPDAFERACYIRNLQSYR